MFTLVVVSVAPKGQTDLGYFMAMKPMTNALLIHNV